MTRVRRAPARLRASRRTGHAFRNGGDEVAAAHAVYVPPFDGTDRVDAE